MGSAHPRVRYAASQEGWPKPPGRRPIFLRNQPPTTNSGATFLKFHDEMTHFWQSLQARSAKVNTGFASDRAPQVVVGEPNPLRRDICQIKNSKEAHDLVTRPHTRSDQVRSHALANGARRRDGSAALLDRHLRDGQIYFSRRRLRSGEMFRSQLLGMTIKTRAVRSRLSSPSRFFSGSWGLRRVAIGIIV